MFRMHYRHTTCWDVFRGSITVGTHHSCCDVCVRSFRPHLCKPEIWQFRCKILLNREREKGGPKKKKKQNISSVRGGIGRGLCNSTYAIKEKGDVGRTESSKTLEVLKSRYMTGCSAPCKNARPLAAPIAIFTLVPQGRDIEIPTTIVNCLWSEYRINKWTLWTISQAGLAGTLKSEKDAGLSAYGLHCVQHI